ncbi:MAG TPA: cyclic di-GMP phosphodiesterase [Erwinia sp.]|uniref:cyclic di-GMP phosphodiesterase n=1 Tax=Erwinia citreus TaxID=558 RepID=UPI000E8E3486|nr:cyclic di-GMP phosphodiesterase [Erwinia sp.]HBV38492.1 cyclic di-GMP phosphodiesterase [Erwinia sp.]
MPLSSSLTRPLLSPRKIACFSATFGFFLFLAFIIITLIVMLHRRADNHDRLAKNTQAYVLTTLGELKRNLLPLQTLPYPACSAIEDDLSQRAAFDDNIQAILLVKHNKTWCSSLAGETSTDIGQFSPSTDTRKPLDIQLAAAPQTPDKPVLHLWLQSGEAGDGILVTLKINLTPWLLFTERQHDMTGIAIVTGKSALTSWEQRVTDASSLPDDAIKTMTLPGYPLQLKIYGSMLNADDIALVLLAGLLLSLTGGLACYALLTLLIQPGKEILQGIRRGEFHVEYQPVIAAATGQACGLEALLRWTHPEAGRIPPDAFIRYAENKNLIVPLTRHLFELVARDCHVLQHAVPAGTNLNLNLSPAHLSDKGFYQDVLRWLDAMPQDHFSYVFEITERTMVETRNAQSVFDWLRSHDIRIALDDFGTGHSALIYLEKFRFDYLKIDRGFVKNIARESFSSPVLDAVLALAKKLNLLTVAEGVETGEQARWLRHRGVCHFQGFLFSRPRTVAQLIEYFQHERSEPAAG